MARGAALRNEALEISARGLVIGATLSATGVWMTKTDTGMTEIGDTCLETHVEDQVHGARHWCRDLHQGVGDQDQGVMDRCQDSEKQCQSVDHCGGSHSRFSPGGRCLH